MQRPADAALTWRLGKAATGPSARLWAENGIGAPPVFIVVCNNTATSELAYKHISGFERQYADGNMAQVTFQTRTAHPPFLISADEPAVLRAEKATQSMGLAPVTVVSAGGLDANGLLKHGAPTVTFGTSQAEIHTVNGYVDVPEFAQVCRPAVAIATLE